MVKKARHLKTNMIYAVKEIKTPDEENVQNVILFFFNFRLSVILKWFVIYNMNRLSKHMNYI